LSRARGPTGLTVMETALDAQPPQAGRAERWAGDGVVGGRLSAVRCEVRRAGVTLRCGSSFPGGGIGWRASYAFDTRR